MKISELLVEIGFVSDKTKLDDFVGSLGKLNMTSIAAALGFGTLAAVLTETAKQSMEAAHNVKTLSEVTGVDASKLDKYTTVLGKVGIGAKEAHAALKGLFKLTRDAIMGDSKSKEIFYSLNVDPRSVKDPTDLLGKIQEKIKDKTLSVQTRTKLSEMAGIGDDTFYALERIKTLKEEISHAWAMSNDEIANLQKAKDIGSVILTNIGTGWNKFWGGLVPNLSQNMTMQRTIAPYVLGPGLSSITSSYLDHNIIGTLKSMMSGNKNITVNNHINVENKDARDIAEEIKKQFDRSLSDADRQSVTVD
jgi:hypothetical protein